MTYRLAVVLLLLLLVVGVVVPHQLDLRPHRHLPSSSASFLGRPSPAPLDVQVIHPAVGSLPLEVDHVAAVMTAVSAKWLSRS